MEDAGAIPMAIRRAEKAATPPVHPPGRRRRSSIAATGAAWPAFPTEANAGAGVGGAAVKRSPAASGGNGDGGASKSPSSSGFSPVSFRGGGSVSGGVGVGTGARSGSSCGGCRVSGCGGVKSPGIVRKTSACCNSCRPSAAAGAAHHNNQHQQHGKGENGDRIEYDDVFGGPPKYLASTCNGRKMSIPDYDDIFRTTNRRSFSSIAQQPVRTKSRTAELPVFDPPEYDTEVFGGPPAEKPMSPATIAYEDVFGGPLTGPRTRLLKDLLRCSGAGDSKWKSGSKSKGSSQSDCSFQSPISSTHGNPIYEFESEVFGDAKDFKGSSFGSSGKSPQAYVEPESVRKPVMTSVSASSSPFTEYFDDSTVHSYSSRASKNAKDRVVQLDHKKMYRNVPRPVHDVNKDFVVEPDMEVASTSSTESFELEFTKRASSKKAFGNNHRKRREKSFSALKRPSTVEAEDASPLQTSSNVVSPEVESLHMPSTVTYFQSATFGNERHEDVYAATQGTEQDRETNDFDLEQSNEPLIKCFSAQADEDLQHFKFTDVASKREAKQVSFITVNHVKLTTEPTNVPPARPAPSRNLEVMSEKEMSELLETEAFMEYSIKDLDGLVAEEYLVSQESVSDSSPSSLSVSNSLKTSASGRSYEDEDSEHSYAEDSILGVEGKATEGESVRELERRPVKRPVPKQLHEREKVLETERNSYGRDKKDKVQPKFRSEEEQTNGPAIETKQDTKTGQNVLGDSVVLEKGSTETVKEQVADSFPEESTDELGRSKSSSEEMISSSSSSFEEQMFPKGAPLSDDWSLLCVPDFEDIEGETPERRRSRRERHQRALERVAKVLAEKNSRELEHERAEAEKQRVAEVLDDVIKRWAAGKQGNLRALLSTLQYILWPECGWQPVSLMDIIEPAFVRKAYRKATLCVHPDKLQQKGASIEHKYIAEKVFDHLQEAWTIFNYEQLF